MMRHYAPQEVEVWYVLPALRKEISLMLKSRGMKQKEIAGLLGMTEAAISQYSTSKRAAIIRFGGEIREEIRKSAEDIARKKSATAVAIELQRLCRLLKERHILCSIHKKYSKLPLKECGVCFA